VWLGQRREACPQHIREAAVGVTDHPARRAALRDGRFGCVPLPEPRSSSALSVLSGRSGEPARCSRDRSSRSLAGVALPAGPDAYAVAECTTPFRNRCSSRGDRRIDQLGHLHSNRLLCESVVMCSDGRLPHPPSVLADRTGPLPIAAPHIPREAPQHPDSSRSLLLGCRRARGTNPGLPPAARLVASGTRSRHCQAAPRSAQARPPRENTRCSPR
jgi:hypothetical protein